MGKSRKVICTCGCGRFVSHPTRRAHVAKVTKSAGECSADRVAGNKCQRSTSTESDVDQQMQNKRRCTTPIQDNILPSGDFEPLLSDDGNNDVVPSTPQSARVAERNMNALFQENPPPMATAGSRWEEESSDEDEQNSKAERHDSENKEEGAIGNKDGEDEEEREDDSGSERESEGEGEGEDEEENEDRNGEHDGRNELRRLTMDEAGTSVWDGMDDERLRLIMAFGWFLAIRVLSSADSI